MSTKTAALSLSDPSVSAGRRGGQRSRPEALRNRTPVDVVNESVVVEADEAPASLCSDISEPKSNFPRKHPYRAVVFNNLLRIR